MNFDSELNYKGNKIFMNHSIYLFFLDVNSLDKFIKLYSITSHISSLQKTFPFENIENLKK